MAQAELKLDIDAELLEQARSAGLALTPVVEAALRQALANDDQPRRPLFEAKRPVIPVAEAEARARRWAEENAEAIADYNRRIAERGVFGEDLRRW